MTQTLYAHSKQKKSVNENRLLHSSVKVLKLLEFIGTRVSPVSLAEIVKQIGGNRGTVYQQLQTLTQTGWVIQNSEQKYFLALKIVNFAKNALEQLDIFLRISPLLEQLAQVSGEAPAIAILDGKDVLIIKRVESKQLVRADIQVGTRMPISDSASGLILVAYASPEKQKELRDIGIKFPSKDKLDQIRTKGYATQIDTWQKGLSAVAVPLFIGFDRQILSLSMACPTERFDEKRTIAHLNLTVDQFKQSL